MPRPSLVRPRTHAFVKQSGRCYYCGLPMWANNLLEFATAHGITPKQARALQCTGEHLTAHKDGGSAARSNIVAACLFCNAGRHSRKTDLSPDGFKQLVRKRMEKKRWHAAWVFDREVAKLSAE